jgi:VanZ family protein
MEKILNKKFIFSVILIILIFITLNFIFSNSFDSTVESSEKSDWVLEKVEPVLEKVVGKERATVKLVRKLAHFLEFFVLGAELSILCFLNGIDKTYVAFIGLLSATTDETIQVFSKRGAQLTDVWIDFSAIIFAIFIVFLLEKSFDFFKSQ